MIKLDREGNLYLKEIDSEIDDYKETLIKDSSYIFPNLNENIELNKDVTLRSYFKMLENYPEIQVLDNFILSFLEEYKKCSYNNEDYLEYLELRKIALYEHVIFDKESVVNELFEHVSDEYTSCEMYCSFDGYKDNETYGIEFSPLQKLIDCPLKLGNNKIYIYIDKKMKEYSADECSVSLYDFIKEIIWELSFCGSPKNRDIKWEEITETVNEYMEEIKHPERFD
jgi:hypothetical protein